MRACCFALARASAKQQATSSELLRLDLKVFRVLVLERHGLAFPAVFTVLGNFVEDHELNADPGGHVLDLKVSVVVGDGREGMVEVTDVGPHPRMDVALNRNLIRLVDF